MLVMLLAVAFCVTSSAYAEWKPEMKFMKLAASRPGGKWYALGAPLTKIWEAVLPGVQITMIPGGGISNPKTLNKGDAQIAWALSPDVYNATKANPPYETEHQNFRHLASLYPAYMEVVVPKKSDINGFADLSDKRISGGAVGFTTVNILKFILQSYGLSFEKIKANGGSVMYLNYGDMVLSMKDGHLDCAAFMGGIPFSAIIELNVQPGIRFLEIDQTHLEKITAGNPGFTPIKVPKGTYKGQDKSVQTVGAVTTLLVHKDLSDETVYRLAKALWDNLGKLMEVSPGTAKDIHLETALKGIACPIHPGAKRYYDEKGIK